MASSDENSFFSRRLTPFYGTKMKKNETFFFPRIISVENKNNITGAKANCGWTFHFFTVATFSKYLLYTIKSWRLKKRNLIPEFFLLSYHNRRENNRTTKFYMGCGFRLKKVTISVWNKKNQTNSLKQKKLQLREKFLLPCSWA